MTTAVLPRPAETQPLGLRGIRVFGLVLLASALAPSAGSELPARPGGSTEAIAPRAGTQASAAPAVSLTQSPLVMRSWARTSSGSPSASSASAAPRMAVTA
jgi:hypothetical protein